MTTAGFKLSAEPGIWVVETEIDGVPAVIPVDLIVPEGAAPPGGRRGASARRAR